MDYTHLQKLVTLIIGYPLPKSNDNKKISNFGKGRHTFCERAHVRACNWNVKHLPQQLGETGV